MSNSDSSEHEDRMLKKSAIGDADGERVELVTGPPLQNGPVDPDARATEPVTTPGTVSDTEQNSVGTIIGRVYRLESLLGTGGMGAVYKAVHILTGQTVALKLLHSQHLDEASVLRFQQESKAISKLDHPHIAAAHYFDVTEYGVPFLAMDLVEGASLSSLLDQQKCLPWRQAVEIAIQICSAVQHAHDRGIIHRDLKPSNVLLTKTKDGTNFVKIVDFGIAKVTLDDMKAFTLTETGAVLGTPLYMSPEQCRGLKLDSRSDIYSLGCVLYEMLTGQPPHVGQSTLDTIYKHINERAKPIASNPTSTLPSWPAELGTIVSRALERDPQKRYQTMEALRHDLSQVLLYRPGGHLRLTASPSRSRETIIVLLLVILTSAFAITHVYRLAHWGDLVDKTATIPWQTVSDQQPAPTSSRFEHKTPRDDIDQLFAEEDKARQLLRNDAPSAEAVQRAAVAMAEKFKQQIGQVEYEKAYNLLGDILYKQHKFREANLAYKDTKFLLMSGADAPYFDSDDFFTAVARRGDTYYELGLAAMSADKEDARFAIPSKYFELAIRDYQRCIDRWQAGTAKQAAYANASERIRRSNLLFNQATACLNMARASVAWRQFERSNHTEERTKAAQAFYKEHPPRWSGNAVAASQMPAPEPAPLYERAIELYPQSSQPVGYLQVAQGLYGDYLMTMCDYFKALDQWRAAHHVPSGFWSPPSRFSMLKSMQ